ncbi:DUF4240 domain-containing protein [Streptomyces sp. NPDC058653]|uniref:DUF4240 domain-containing protein n=1 Tax=Streptomyces sp. NPDC058653 TaxID=3346576 RepID=UPI00366A2629
MTDFWGIIGSNPAQSGDDVRSALDRVSGRLDGLDATDLVKFSEELRGALYGIDRRELAEIPVVLAVGLELPQTSDHFLYSRCGCILAGRGAYDAALRSASEFTCFVRPFFQAAEGLLYLAPSVYERKVGREMRAVERDVDGTTSLLVGPSAGRGRGVPDDASPPVVPRARTRLGLGGPAWIHDHPGGAAQRARLDDADAQSSEKPPRLGLQECRRHSRRAIGESGRLRLAAC